MTNSETPPDAGLPSNKSVDSATPENNPTDEHRGPPNRITAPNFPPSVDRNNHREHCRPDQTPWWKYAIELGGVLTVVAYTIVANRQLGAMNGQIGQMKGAGKQTDQLICLYRQQVAKLNEQLGELRKSVGETHTLAEQTERNGDILLNQERPWVGIVPPVTVQWKKIDGDNISFLVTLAAENFGKSPAIRTMFGVAFVGSDPYQIGARQDSTCKMMVTFSQGDVWEATDPKTGNVSSGDRNTMTKLYGASNLRRVPKFGTVLFPTQTFPRGTATRDPMPDGKNVGYFAGCIVYWDANRIPHKALLLRDSQYYL